jgi:hypothetical protein
MATSKRLFASVAPQNDARFTAMAAQSGLSKSKLLALLVDAALARNAVPEKTPPMAEAAGKGVGPGAAVAHRAGESAPYIPPAKYTVRLRGEDAAALERRAEQRNLLPSSYAGQVLRAHLRAAPPVPYAEFQTIKRLVNELGGIRGALFELLATQRAGQCIDAPIIDAIQKLLPALKITRQEVQDILTANSRSWEAPDG